MESLELIRKCHTFKDRNNIVAAFKKKKRQTNKSQKLDCQEASLVSERQRMEKIETEDFQRFPPSLV